MVVWRLAVETSQRVRKSSPEEVYPPALLPARKKEREREKGKERREKERKEKEKEKEKKKPVTNVSSALLLRRL